MFKVVERVTDRLRSRIACGRKGSGATAFADLVEKAWREEYARSLPTQDDVDRKWSSIPRKIKRNTINLKAKPETLQQKSTEISLGKPERRFALKTHTSSSPKCKRLRPSDMPAEDCDSSEIRKDIGNGTLPQKNVRGEREAGLKSDSFGARDRKQTGYGGYDQGGIGTAAGKNRASDKQTGYESQVGLLTVASASTAAHLPERKDGGVSTGEACAGDDDEDKSQAANPGRKISSPVVDNMDANEETNSLSPRADQGHTEDEEDKDSALPDVVVTANFVGQLKKGARYRRKRWKLELEGGAIETSESVFVFDKCECTFISPWKQ